MEILLIFTENLRAIMMGIYGNAILQWSVIVLTIFDVSWKSIALWRAGRMGMIEWFVVLFFVNSIGILPIIFILKTRERYNQYVYGGDSPPGTTPVPA